MNHPATPPLSPSHISIMPTLEQDGFDSLKNGYDALLSLTNDTICELNDKHITALHDDICQQRVDMAEVLEDVNEQLKLVNTTYNRSVALINSNSTVINKIQQNAIAALPMVPFLPKNLFPQDNDFYPILIDLIECGYYSDYILTTTRYNQHDQIQPTTDQTRFTRTHDQQITTPQPPSQQQTSRRPIELNQSYHLTPSITDLTAPYTPVNAATLSNLSYNKPSNKSPQQQTTTPNNNNNQFFFFPQSLMDSILSFLTIDEILSLGLVSKEYFIAISQSTIYSTLLATLQATNIGAKLSYSHSVFKTIQQIQYDYLLQATNLNKPLIQKQQQQTSKNNTLRNAHLFLATPANAFFTTKWNTCDRQYLFNLLHAWNLNPAKLRNRVKMPKLAFSAKHLATTAAHPRAPTHPHYTIAVKYNPSARGYDVKIAQTDCTTEDCEQKGTATANHLCSKQHANPLLSSSRTLLDLQLHLLQIELSNSLLSNTINIKTTNKYHFSSLLTQHNALLTNELQPELHTLTQQRESDELTTQYLRDQVQQAHEQLNEKEEKEKKLMQEYQEMYNKQQAELKKLLKRNSKVENIITELTGHLTVLNKEIANHNANAEVSMQNKYLMFLQQMNYQIPHAVDQVYHQLAAVDAGKK